MAYGLQVDVNGEETIPLRRDSTFIQTQVLKDSDENVYFDLWEPPFNYNPQRGDQIHTVTGADAGRPDLISQQYYGNVRLYWLICNFNSILHPFNELVPGRKLIIPNTEAVLNYLSSEAASR